MVKEVLLSSCGDGLLDTGALKDCQNATCFLYCNTREISATGFFAAIEIEDEKYHVIVTNNHVFSSKEEAMSGVASFYYERNMQFVDSRLRPDLLFYTDKDLDYTIIGCDHDQIENTFCINPIKFEYEKDLIVGDNVLIFQHPRGETKQFSYKAITAIECPFVYYNADTDDGSSGSCVLRNLKLIALHSKGIDALKCNKGVLCSEILNHLNHGKYTLPKPLSQHTDPKILEVIYHQVRNWRRFGRLIGLEEDILDTIEADYKSNAERIERCIKHKIDTSIKTIEWNYWKERLLRLKEGEGIVQELEGNFPNLADSAKEEDNEQGNEEQFIDIFDMISTTISDWKRLASVLDIEYIITEIEGNDKYNNRLEEKVYRCINEKKTSPPEWCYWRDKLLEYSSNVNKQNEKDLVEDIEMLYPVLLNDDRIDLSNVCHKSIGEFSVYAHHADRTENSKGLPVTFKEIIKIYIGAGIVLHKTVEDIVNMQEDYFCRFSILQDIRKFDFSNINKVRECPILETQYAWLKTNRDYGFTVKGYNAEEHLKMFSDHVNTNAQTDSILTYSAKHNVILYINKSTEDIRFIKKTMRDNCFNIRALKTSNQCLDGEPFIYVPVTLHDKDKNEVDAIVNCSTCVDSGLIVSLDELKDLEHFEIWWKKLLPELKSIRRQSKIQQNDNTKCLLQSILGFTTLTSIDLPTYNELPEVAIKEAQKIIMLTPEQRDVVYSDKKFKIIKGPYGSGKTIIAQEIIKLVSKNMGENEFIFYLLHDSNSIYLREMIKLAKTLKNENIIAAKVADFNKDTKTLSSILKKLLENNPGKVMHVVIEEFNGEVMDEEEVYKIKVLLQNEEYKNSHIVLVAQSMENERFEIQDESILPYERKFKYELLEDETCFKLYFLSLLVRSSVEINSIIDVTIPILRDSVMASIIPKFNEKINSINLPKRTPHKPKLIVEADSSSSIGDLPKEKEYSSSIVMDEIDILFKYCSTNASKYQNQTHIESRYTYVGKRDRAHNVKGRMPSVYYPFNKDVITYVHQVFSIAEVLKDILSEEKGKQVVICLNKDSLIILKDVLNESKIKWIDDPDRFYAEDFDILLTEYIYIRGCEFLNVILIYPTNETHLKHNMVNCLSRCKLHLRVIVLDTVDPDKTLLRILKEWKNKELVQIYDDDYLKNVDKLELQKFQHLLKKDEQHQTFNMDDPKIRLSLQYFQTTKIAEEKGEVAHAVSYRSEVKGRKHSSLGRGEKRKFRETKPAPTMYEAFKEGKILITEVKNTIATGLAPPFAGEKCLEVVRAHVNEIVLVAEDEIKNAMKELYNIG